MKTLKLTEKDYEAAKGYIMGMLSSSALNDYENQLKQWYDENDFQRLKPFINEKRAQLGQADQLRAEEEKVRRASYVYHLERLDPHKVTPRDTESDFFKDISGKPPLFGKDKWKDKFANAKIIYAAVVQANSALWNPGDSAYLPAVFVFSVDPLNMYNKEWLSTIAEQVGKIKNSAQVPDDCKNLIKTMRDDQSIFCFKIGKSITEKEAWCATIKIDKQTDLPNRCLPNDGIVPFLLCGELKENYSPITAQIPGKYYC